jgi:SAM-dependent methyltransferase
MPETMTRSGLKRRMRSCKDLNCRTEGNDLTYKVFSRYAKYYDLLYHDKDYTGEANYVASLISRFQNAAQTILELGSGTGKHALYLAEKGYSVVGVERSDGMIEQARLLANRRREVLEAAGRTVPQFMQGDIRSARIGRSFDAVVSLFHVISYQTSHADILAAFKTARTHTGIGGLFLFDVWYGPAVLHQRPDVRVKRMANDEIEVTRIAEPVLRANENRVDVKYDVFIRDRASDSICETQEIHELRYMFADEIEWLLREAGFSLLHHEEWMTGRPSGVHTWSVCFIAAASN